jgi:hypothetical protein
MKLSAALLVVGLSGLGSGCTYYVNAARNLTEAPIDAADNVHQRLRNHRLAKEAWEAVRGADPGHEYSEDYACGFKEGFADYIYAGGHGLPPEAPPYCYRKSNHQTPAGVQAAEDWFAGFRHGARVAKESGLRQYMLVPTATPGPFPEFDSSVKLARLAQAAASAPAEPLPAPRKEERPADKPAPPSKVTEPVSAAVPPVSGRIILDAGEPAPPPRPASTPRPAPPPPPPSRPVPGTVIFEESR